MVHDLKPAEASQKRRSSTVASIIAFIVTLLLSTNFTVGLLAIPFAVVILLACGRVNVIRYDDILKQLEIIEYCPWLPGKYRKTIPRTSLKHLVCTIYFDDDGQELSEVIIANTANEFILLREQMRPDDENLERFSALLKLEIIRKPA